MSEPIMKDDKVYEYDPYMDTFVESEDSVREIKDSGTRREFKSGAVRDIVEGKGRCDLMPLSIITKFLYKDDFLSYIGHFIEYGDSSSLSATIRDFVEVTYEKPATALLELAKHYEDGCKKYGERNWEKGIPMHSFIDSAIRHYLKFRRGDIDEFHDRAFMWNIIGALWTLDNHPELDDIEHNKKETK